MTTLSKNYLGPKSYPGVVGAIHEAFTNAKPLTQTGKELVKRALVIMNESTTPILDLKEFTTNAEKVAPDDTGLMEIVDFARKEVQTGDLNCIINIAKEEHMQNERRTGNPDPAATLKSFNEMFGEPATVIEKGIKEGIFRGMNSDLSNELHSIIAGDGPSGKTKNKIVDPTVHHEGNILNESETMFSPDGVLAMYPPIAVRAEDPANNRILFLTESAVLTFDRTNETFFSLNESEYKDLNIPAGHRRLMTALTSLGYDPATEAFSLNENWDFNLSINKDGKAVLSKNGNSTEIPDGEITTFLMESMDIYERDKVAGFNRINYTKDVDNFNVLLANHGKLTKLDKLRTIRNLNENTYITVDTRDKIVPTFITSTKGPQLFESYGGLIDEALVILKESVADLFVPHIKNEQQFMAARQNKIEILNENQRDLNRLIGESENIKRFAEAGSPAMDRINENEKLLNEGLEKNLVLLNNVVNHANPYFNKLNEAISNIEVTDFDKYVENTVFQPIKDVLKDEKIKELLQYIDTKDEVNILVSSDLTHYLLVYAQNDNWVVDLWTLLTGYNGDFQQNNFGSKLEIGQMLAGLNPKIKLTPACKVQG
jgi:hypothetical protein